MRSSKSRKKRSVAAEIIEGLTEFADALEAGEDISRRFNCHRVVLDVRPTAYDGKSVKLTRSILGASQSIFARFLGLSVQAVRAWEQDLKTPSEIACRFMDEIRNDPKYWQARMTQLVKSKGPRRGVMGCDHDRRVRRGRSLSA
ncbi:MAG: transcriptional regulator [Planctomycetia bacterium]|nr:transcriptional regulator [Planctomycetia bacterium]